MHKLSFIGLISMIVLVLAACAPSAAQAPGQSTSPLGTAPSTSPLATGPSTSPLAPSTSPLPTTGAPGSTSPLASPLASPSAMSSQGQITVQTSQDPKLGTILVDPKGMTLYTFKNDQSGSSSCTGTCAQIWPPLTVSQGATPMASSGASGTLATIQRPDGTTQVTYNGMPLYNYSKDSKPGDTNGQGVGGVWFVAKP